MKIIASLGIIFVFVGSLSAQPATDTFAGTHRSLVEAATREATAAREALANQPSAQPAIDLPDLAEIETAPGLTRLRELKPVIGPIFTMHDVPQEFLLVGLVESGYRTNAVSPADAVGMWQFVASTARRFGLIDRTGDYRTNLIRSTHAAAEYLKSLLAQYKDWRLALAAYNAGEDRVDRAIAAAGSADFSELARRRLLPEETLTYVPAVLKRMAEARSAGLIQAGGGKSPPITRIAPINLRNWRLFPLTLEEMH